MTTALPQLLTLPYISINNILGVPINTDNDNDGTPSRRVLPYASITYYIILTSLFKEYMQGRSYTDDQSAIYRSLESKLSSNFGLEGRPCLQRFVCELQKFPIHDWTVVGQLITAVFTPREDGSGLLRDYVEAQLVGQLEEPDSCETNYSQNCPFSVFNYFKNLDDLEQQYDLLQKDDLELQDDLKVNEEVQPENRLI